MLSGHTRGLVQWLLKHVPNQWLWLGSFGLLTAFDLAAVSGCAERGGQLT